MFSIIVTLVSKKENLVWDSVIVIVCIQFPRNTHKSNLLFLFWQNLIQPRLASNVLKTILLVSPPAFVSQMFGSQTCAMHQIYAVLGTEPKASFMSVEHSTIELSLILNDDFFVLHKYFSVPLSSFCRFPDSSNKCTKHIQHTPLSYTLKSSAKKKIPCQRNSQIICILCIVQNASAYLK